MKKRAVSIIHELIQNKNTCTIVGLAEKFSVSQRTIRNDLNGISDILRENQLQELTLGSGGLVISGDDFEKIRQFTREEDLYSYKLSKDERIWIASAFLVNSSEYITLSTLLIAVITAVIIVLAMNLVGSLLISALVIFPALSAMRIFKTFLSVTVCSVIISVLCAITGMLLSILAGRPVGSTIVATDIVAFLICCVAERVTGGK